MTDSGGERGHGWLSERRSRLTFGAVLFAAIGLAQTASFDHVPSSWLHWFSFAPLVWLAVLSSWSLRSGFALAWLCGTVFWTINVGWIAHTIGVHGGLGAGLGLGLLLALALYMGLYWGIFVLVGSVAFRASTWTNRVLGVIRGLTVSLGLASLWVLLEIIREWMFTGFPWSPLGEALVRTPGALDASAWVGVRGLSLLVLFVNAFGAIWIHGELQGRSETATSASTDIGRRVWGLRVLAVSVAVFVLVLFSVARWRGDRLQPSAAIPPQQPLPIRVVQPNVPINPPAAEVVANYRRLMELSRCGVASELVIWPESAAFPYSWQHHAGLRRDVLDALEDRCDLLFNTAWQMELPDRSIGFANTALLATQSSSDAELDLQRYDKNHLVPYGEYVPLRELLPFVSQLARSVGEFEHGEDPTLLRWRDALFGMSICFEVLFPKEVAERTRLGATALMVLTNDAWFGDTRAPHQHLVSARFRAAENRRPLVFAAVTGTSALVDPRGGVVERLSLDTADVLSADLVADLGHLADPSQTIYSRAPWVIDVIALLLFAISSALCRLGARLTS